jgi:hypothetical protein
MWLIIKMIWYIFIMENNQLCTTHNIKQLEFSGLRGFGSRASDFLGGYRRAPKTQPFHIVKRCATLTNILQTDKLSDS